MSDLCMYELEDIIWDDFCHSDDHIVPHPGGQRDSEHSLQSDKRKKPRREAIGISDNSRDQSAVRYSTQDKEQNDASTLTSSGNTMLEKDTWSHGPDGVFPSSCDGDSINEASSLASENTRISSNRFKSNNVDSVGSDFCTDDAILTDKNATVDSNSYDYSISEIPQADGDLSFFGNNHDDKDSNDLLYYNWDDIGNFEDVDRMFRSCDSTFGLGTGNEEVELGWFSSSDAIGGSEDVLKSDFKFSCPQSEELPNILENHNPLAMDDVSDSIHDSGMRNAPVSYGDSTWPPSEDDSAAIRHLSFTNESSISGRNMPKEQGFQSNGGQIKSSTNNHSGKNGMVNAHRKRSKHQNQSEGKRKDQYLQNGNFQYYSNLSDEDTKPPPEHAPHQSFASMSFQQQACGANSFSYLPDDPYLSSDYGHQTNQISGDTPIPAVKSENSCLTSISSKESCTSNQVLSVDGPHDHSYRVTAVATDENREELHKQHAFQSPYDSDLKKMDLAVQGSVCLPVVEKQIHHSGNETESHRDVEGGAPGVPSELGSSNVQENSSLTSGSDEISVEATSFRQLQVVLEQLDLRTKLCIRDSLYRLARSAEQRHNYANPGGSIRNEDDTCGALITEGPNKFSGFVDIETDTNPIDRSIAHLLFHRPSDTSLLPAQSSLSFKSSTMIDGSINGSPIVSEKYQEETAAGN